mgnify:FL=1
MKTENEDEKVNTRKKFHFDNVYFESPRLYEDILLYQIGDLSCESGYVIGEHEQYCYEISYIVSGKGLFYTNGHSYEVRKGDIYMNLPGERHNGIADKIDPFRFFYLGYVFKKYQDEQNQLNHIGKMFDQIKNPVIKDKFNIQVPFLNIFSEIINGKNYADLMIKTYLHQIVVLAYRNFFESWEKEYTHQSGQQKSKQVVYEIINHIDTHLYDINDLSEIAAELGYSYSYLSRVFSLETGLSIQDYYQKKRFERALDLLKNSDLSITRIAEDLHYQSIHSFSKAFRKNFGFPPTVYQELCAKKMSKEQ